jgi:hypothetical protein
MVKMSAQVTATGTNPSGTLQLQVSNDNVRADNVFTNTTFTNWSNLGSPVTVSSAATTLIAQQDMCYRAMRAVYTDTFANVSTITAVADVASSLHGTYFLASSVTANYYFLFDNGSAVTDPAPAGRTKITVTFTPDDTANTIGGLIRAAAASKGWTVTGSNAQAILTNSATGPTTPASDGAVPTGFTIANTQPSGTISVNIMALGF